MSIILSITKAELLFIETTIGRLELIEGYEPLEHVILASIQPKIQAQKVKKKARKDFVIDKSKEK